MKPAPFRYYAPETLTEAVGLLREHGDEAKVLAGGQSLVPLMNMRLARPSVLVDICRIAELNGVSGDDTITIGATTRQLAVSRSSKIAHLAPIIRQVMPFVGHPATQTRGTLGGIASHADPAAEVPPVLLLLDAEFVAEGSGGERVIQAEDFFTSSFKTDLRDGEILTQIRLPAVKSGVHSAFRQVARRHGAFSIVGVAAQVKIGDDRIVEAARLALCGVAERPVRAKDAEAFMAGRQCDRETALEAGRIVSSQLNPPSDLHASARYRQEVANVLVRRVLSDVQTSVAREG